MVKTIKRIEDRYKRGGFEKEIDYYRSKNNLYRRQLRKNPTKEELIFKEYMSEIEQDVSFQKGFITPFSRIVDFYIPKRKVIIEIDGGYHLNTTRQDNYKDLMWLQKRGMRTLRIKNEDVLNGNFKAIYQKTILEIESGNFS